MTTVITMRLRTKNMTMISQSMKITLTKIMMMKTKITTMKTMMMKITTMKIMMTMTTMTKTTTIEEEEDQETETNRETAREDSLPEAVEAVLVEDQGVVRDQDRAHQEEEETPEVPVDQDPEEEAGLQAHQTQTAIIMIADMTIQAGQEVAGTEAEDLQDQDLAQIPVQIPADQVQDQETAEADQDQEITAVQVGVLIQDQVQDHQEEVSLQ